MKVLFVSNKFPYPPKDGGTIATFQHVWGLATNGADVTVLSINTKKHYCDISAIPPEVSSRINCKAVYMDTTLSAFHALKNLLFSKLPYNAVRFITYEFEKALVEVLQEQPFDIIQLEGLYLCPYIPIIRSHSKALISYRAHNIEHEIWQRNLSREKNHLKKRYLKILASRLLDFEKSFVNQYDLLVPITARDGQTFAEWGNTRPVHVSPTGISPRNYEPLPQKTVYPTVFHLGALDWFPNQEGLLWFLRTVWRYLSKDFPEVRFCIAGRNAPEWLISEFKKFRNIEFLGEVEDAHAFLNAHAIMVVPLLSGGGMRIKIVEGMALQKTIVSTPVGAEGIQVSHGKEMLIASNPEEFGACLEKLLTNKDLYDEIGQNALKFVRSNFDSDQLTKNLFDFYSTHINDI